MPLFAVPVSSHESERVVMYMCFRVLDVPVSSHESERVVMYMCFRVLDVSIFLLCFYIFSIGFWNSFDSVVYFGTVSTVWFILEQFRQCGLFCFSFLFQIYYSVKPFSFVYNNRNWGFRPFLYQMRYLWQQGRSLLVVLFFQYEKQLFINDYE